MTKEEVFKPVVREVYSKVDVIFTLEMIHRVQRAIANRHFSEPFNVYELTVDEFTDFLCSILMTGEGVDYEKA